MTTPAAAPAARSLQRAQRLPLSVSLVLALAAVPFAGCGGDDVGTATRTADPGGQGGGGGSSGGSAGAGGLRDGGGAAGTGGAGGAGAGGAAVGTPAKDGPFDRLDASDDSACVMTKDHDLYCWGGAFDGPLGDGSTKPSTSLLAIGDRSWRSFSTGSGTRCAVKDDGSLWCWGENAYGQFADLAQKEHLVPTRVGDLDEWVTPVVGNGVVCGIKKDQSLWCKGANYAGQLGRGDVVDSIDEPFVRVGATAQWEQAAVGDGQVCGIQTDGSLYCWGANEKGQVGNGKMSKAVSSPVQVGPAAAWAQVATGLGSTCAVQKNGTLWCWGYDGTYPQQEDGQPGIHADPVQVGSSNAWTRVATDGGNTCGIQQDGSLWCWGFSSYGVGDGTVEARRAPVQVGAPAGFRDVVLNFENTCAIQTGGSLWCWGNSSELLQATGATDDALVPGLVPAP